MSSGQVHGVAGFAVGALVAAADQDASKNVFAVLASGGLGAMATRWPDMLEPADHPNHRQFFHSIAFAAFVGKVTVDAYRWEPTEDWERIARMVVLVAGAAYLAHLALDFRTPKSLPLLGK